MFECQRCGHTGRYSAWVTSRWHLENRMQRCDRCGTAHSCAAGRLTEAIPPALLPIHAGTRLSPWHDARYRPCIIGAFECDFRDIGRRVLYWNGTYWEWGGYRVGVRELYKWRGCWAAS